MARAGDELVNPLTGERIVFIRTAAQTNGELLEMDDFWTERGHRAPEHIHPEMEERWEIISGEASFEIGGVQSSAGPGDRLTAPPGVAHVAWNGGTGPVHLRIEMTPALGWEHFVERLFSLASTAQAAERGSPDPSLLLDLISRFPREIALAPPRSAGERGEGER